MFASYQTRLGSILVAGLFSSAIARAQHAGDIVVGRSAADQLKAEIGDEIHLLATVQGPLLFGWTGDEPGFEHLEADEPDEDMFMLEPGAQIRVECVSVSPALKAWAPGFGSVIDGPGDSILLGDHELHAHVTWHIDTNDPAYDSGQKVWQITLKLVDTGSTMYAQSESFVVSFSHNQAIPAVSQWGLLVLILAILTAATLTVRVRQRSWRFAGRMGTAGIFAGTYWLIPASQVCAQHAGDMVLGRAGGRVAWSSLGLDPGTEYLELIPVDTFIQGWSNNAPGFDSVTESQGGVAPFLKGSEIWMEVISLDPALFVIDNVPQVLEFPGDAGLLGDHHLHAHLTFFVDLNDPSFDPHQCAWGGVFKFTDEGGSLQDSEPFSLLFTNVTVRHEDEAAGGDFDKDSDVDLRDQRALVLCLAGQGHRPHPHVPAVTTCEVGCHNAFDFDDDLDVDLIDFAEFQVVFGH